VLRVTLKGLAAHRLRFALTGLAVVLGVAFLAGTLILSDTIRRTFDQLFRSANEGIDVWVRSREKLETPFGTQAARIPVSLVPRIEAVPGVATYRGRPVVQPAVQLFAQLVGRDGEPVGGGAGPPSLGLNWDPFPMLNPWEIVQGRPPERDDEIVVNRRAAEVGNLRVGDRVTVLTQQPPRPYRISGIATFGTAASPAGATIVLFTEQEARRLTGTPDQVDGIAVHAADGVTEEQLARDVRRALSGAGVEVITGAELTAENRSDFERALSFFNTALLVFALVALFVCCFLIVNTFSIVVGQRTRELALLRAMGATSGQVSRSVLGEAVVVGAAAAGLGLVAGIALSAGLKALLVGFGIDVPAGGTVLAARTVIAALLVGTGVTVFSAVAPARRAGRVPPIAALRDVAVERVGAARWRVAAGATLGLAGVAALLTGLFGGVNNGIGLVGAGAVAIFIGVFLLGPVIARPAARLLGWPVARLRGSPGRMARENAARNPRRTTATAAALMIGVALVGFITIFAASTKRSITAAIDRSFRADVVISPKGGGFAGGFSPDLAATVRRIPEVAAATGLRFNVLAVDDETKFVVAGIPAEMDRIFVMDVRAGDFRDLGPDEMAVSAKVADAEGWRVGDEVPVRFPATGSRRVRVGAITGLGLQEGLADYTISLVAYDRNYTERLDSQVYARFRPGVDAQAATRAVTRVARAYPNAEVQDQTEFKEAQQAQVDQLVNLIYALLGLAVVIAGIGIANTLALSIVERTREIGLLRAVGMTRGQVKSSVRWEAVIIALFGSAAGLVIGLFFGWSVVRALRGQGITEFAPPGGQLLVIVLLATALAVAFAAFPARRAARLDVLRAIATE
jgi:putative ABC transport system permease protein